MTPSKTVAHSKGPAISHPLTVTAQQQYITDFAWTLPDWANLFNTTYAQGVRSEHFQVYGIDGCTCQISIFPKDSTNTLSIEFSDSLEILGMQIVIELNNYHYERLELYPVPSIIIFLGSSKFNTAAWDRYASGKTDLYNLLNNRVLRPSASVKVRFEVAKFPVFQSVFFQTHQKSVVANLQAIFEKNTYSDITFVFEDEELHAHKSILAVQSKVFEAMFSNEMSEKDTGRVEVLDIRAEVFEAFLKYLYTRKIDLKKNVTEFLVVADKYEVCELKDLCEKYMLKNLSEQNVVEYLLIADKLCCTALKEKSLTMLQNNVVALCGVMKNESSETFMDLKKILSNDTSKRSENQ
ncbi:BTB and MATH domain-containing protein 40-like [Venturia canescens]|uniref:BTB and MATH domain-containing protein 40-like n=1 Tax=Venturia canescens TaxID=32260 RepID=UPI001C9D05B7|nr:BTB and MATH domain-containing protein 40-like [Venturia canescens]XP_043287881.1 BTB and MATH domain-containing protein 40-like [Venturia canescens]